MQCHLKKPERPPERSARPTSGMKKSIGRLWLRWQADDEFTPLPQARARRSHAAAMHFDKTLHQGKANSESRLGTPRRVVCLHE
jgi:hypothetical protein